MDIFCFGDSITLGEYDSERGGWVSRLKTECMARFVARGETDRCVFNLGIGGETTRMMRSRFTSEIKTRLGVNETSYVILAYGANDAAREGASFRVPQSEYIENLSWAIEEARALRCEVLLLNITPIAPFADGLVNKMGRVRANNVIAAYNEALSELSRRKSVDLVDVYGAFLKHELATLFVADGVHPNALGHRLIGDLVTAKLLK